MVVTRRGARAASCPASDPLEDCLLAAAQTFSVTNTNDNGLGSLRAAIFAANVNPGSDKIVFTGAGAAGTINLASELPDVTDDVAIVGPGANVLTVRLAVPAVSRRTPCLPAARPSTPRRPSWLRPSISAASGAGGA
jgi:hypothetical protein